MAPVDTQPKPIRSVEGLGSVGSRESGEGRLKRLILTARSSSWTPVLVRALGGLFGMLALAAIGALSTARGLAGHAVPVASAGLIGGAQPALAGSEAAVAATERPRTPCVPSASSVPLSQTPKNATLAKSAGQTQDGKIILNLATSEDLMRLPGIGKKRAEAILALRERLGGRFKRVSDLLRIRGIGPRRLKQIAPLLVLDPPPPPPEKEPKGSREANPSN